MNRQEDGKRIEVPAADRTFKNKVRAWLKRFLPAEITGTILAVCVSSGTLYFTGNKILAAFAGSIAETIGFYTIITIQSFFALQAELKRHHQQLSWMHGFKVLKTILIEFGPAEILDSFVLRPLFMYLFPMLLNNYAAGTIVGKIVSDVTFYIPVIISQELRLKFTKKPH